MAGQKSVITGSSTKNQVPIGIAWLQKKIVWADSYNLLIYAEVQNGTQVIPGKWHHMNRRNIQEVTVWHVWKAIGDSQGQALYNGLLLTMATTFLQLGHPTLLAWPSHNITLTSHDFNPGHPTIAWAYLPGLEAKIFNDRDQFNIDPGPVQVKRSQDYNPMIPHHQYRLPKTRKDRSAKIFGYRDFYTHAHHTCSKF